MDTRISVSDPLHARDLIQRLDFPAAFWTKEGEFDSANTAWVQAGKSNVMSERLKEKIVTGRIVQLQLNACTAITCIPVYDKHTPKQLQYLMTWFSDIGPPSEAPHVLNLKKLNEDLPLPWAYLDISGCIITSNTAMQLQLQLTHGQLHKLHYQRLLMSDEHRAGVTHIVETALRGKKGYFLINLIHFHTQKPIAMQVYAVPDYDADGNQIGVSFTAVDVLEHKQLELSSKNLSQWMSESFKNNILAITDCDQNLNLLRWEGSCEKIFGYHTSEVIGKNIFDVIGDDTEILAVVLRKMQQASIDKTATQFSSKNKNRRKNKELIHCQWYNSIYIDAVSNEPHLMSLAVDITEEETIRQKLYLLATTDVLTGLSNHKCLMSQLTLIDFNRPHAVAFIDLDFFKSINDLHGHTVGDELLSQVAGRLKPLMGAKDFFARKSGDEFVLVFHLEDETRSKQHIFNQIEAVFSQDFQMGSLSHQLQASIGVAFSPEHSRVGEQLLRFADLALSKAKSMGKNQTVIYTHDMGNQALNKRLMLELLKIAIKQGQLEVYYQPQYAVSTMKLVACEALLRWKNAAQVFVPTSDFVRLAEDNNLIESLWEYVLERVCAFSKQLNQNGQTVVPISVNLSTMQLKRDYFSNAFEAAFIKHQCQKGAIGIEITESTEINSESNLKPLLKLKEQFGASCAIDDFGTGFSNLASLRALPIDTLKIDRSFIAQLQTDSSPVVDSIIALAHRLGLTVVAEGVETQAQLNELKKLGCDYFQGFLVSPAVPAEHMLHLARL